MNSWLQGSYKFGTQIRPAIKGQEFDIDLGVYFNWAGRPQDGELGALDLKGMVQASLLAYADDDANEAQSVSDPKIRCSRIHFDEDFHIDVPSYHLDADDLELFIEAHHELDPHALAAIVRSFRGPRSLRSLRRVGDLLEELREIAGQFPISAETVRQALELA